MEPQQVAGMLATSPSCDPRVMLRCLIVDDSPRFLDAARGLQEREGTAVVGVASTGAEATRRVERLPAGRGAGGYRPRRAERL
jgi:hypothetical protein